MTDEFLPGPAANALPLAPGRFRMLKEKVFSDPETAWPEYFVAAFSFPRWLAGRWQSRFDQDELARLGFWINSPAPLCLRSNSLRTTRDQLLERLREANVMARAGTQPDAVWLEETAFVQDLPGFHEGLFAVQDESAIAAAALLDPQPGERVLDLCAVPGGKSMHLAALMNNEGHLLAADVDRDRLRRVEESCRRLGVSIVETHVMSRESVDLTDEMFDRILIDAPCSNTGVLGKRPDARWRLSPDDITELASIQARLLREAAPSRAGRPARLFDVQLRTGREPGPCRQVPRGPSRICTCAASCITFPGSPPTAPIRLSWNAVCDVRRNVGEPLHLL